MTDFILSEKSKAEFVEYIAQDGIECWFEGDRFVMPSGQGRTAKGIVIHKLQVWKLKEAAIQEMDEVIKLQDTDLRKYEKQIESLKTQLAVYKEDVQKDAEKIADLEKYQRVNGECINNLVNQKHDYLHRVTMAIAHLDSFDLSRAGMNKLQRGIESALEALRGAND
ncbi:MULTISPECIES: hypothetical protein [unclassified Acinetobacter]|uniref:hypothetical protein n=1 Tax=unclassified Acinetobacter TaxID=196816 RepID=UPI0015D392C5|nr:MULTISPECIES: hypothetical protein [unclassified Acinetobacter]